MVQFSNKILIKRKSNDVFNFLDNLENFPKWNYAVTNISKVDSRINESGSSYRIYRETGGPQEEVYITEWIQGKKISMDVKGGWFPYTMIYEISTENNGTLLINTAKVYPIGVKKLLLSLFQSNIKSAVNQNLRVLKNILEKSKNSK